MDQSDTILIRLIAMMIAIYGMYWNRYRELRIEWILSSFIAGAVKKCS